MSTWENSWAVPHNKAPYGISKQEWIVKGLSSTTFVALVIERAENFKRQTHPLTGRPGNILLMHFDMLGKDYIFANCLACRSKKFDDPTTPFPLDCPIDGLNQPRLGKCGCVCCNGCVLKSITTNVNDLSNANRGYIACPYCKNPRSHEMDTHAWSVTETMLSNIVLDKK
jgi:hypothetical protein